MNSLIILFMDNKEQEKNKSSLEFDKGKPQNEYHSLIQKLRSIKKIINLLEKNFSQKEI